ncbi:MAG: NADH-quinone oxidoreductase subunit NuoK [Planctomycetota bacterium]
MNLVALPDLTGILHGMPLLAVSGLGLSECLILATILFALGVYGVVSRRNAMVMLLSIEIMLNAGNLGALAFARHFEGRAMEMAAERQGLIEQRSTLEEQLHVLQKKGGDTVAVRQQLGRVEGWLSQDQMTVESAAAVGHTGHVLALFVMAIAAAEAAVGLALLIALVRHRDTVDTREIRELRE